MGKKVAKVLSKSAELAKKRVDDLIGDIGVATLKKEDKKESKDLLVETKKEKSNKWLEDQLDLLTKENENLVKENFQLKEDVKKLYNQVKTGKSADVTISDNSKQLMSGVEKIFFELDDVYTGKKFGKPYYEAKIHPLLNKMMATFPFLVESLKRKRTSNK